MTTTTPPTGSTPPTGPTGVDAAVVLEAGRRIAGALPSRHGNATLVAWHTVFAEQVAADLGRDVLDTVVTAVETRAPLALLIP